MSGFLYDAATPCPPRSRSSAFGDESNARRDALNNLWEDSLESGDDTQNIEFTTEIRAPILTGAKPRRRTKNNTSFIIHSDNDEKPDQAAVKHRLEARPVVATSTCKTSLLAQPAQRFRPKVSFAPSPPKHSRRQSEVEPKKRSLERDTEKNNELLRRINGEGDASQSRDALKKDVRRNTVYIPPEDFTVASVFMDLFSPLKSNNLEQYTTEDAGIRSLESQVARKRQAKRLQALSPERAPLQPSSKVAQESCNRVDIPGKNGGKENIPPGMVYADSKWKNFQPGPNKTLSDTLSVTKSAAEQACGRSTRTGFVSKPLSEKTANRSTQKIRDNDKRVMKASSVRDADGVNRTLNARAKDAARPSTLSNPLRNSKTGMNSSVYRKSVKQLKDEYPLVSENITNPALYNEDWLSHQEVILTQLVNGLFCHTNGKSTLDDPAVLRIELLKLYQSAFFTNLYQRLQASLMYGALSIPKDVITRNSRLRHDLGMKRKFIDFWLQTYDLRALRAALETVTGRIIPEVKVSSNSVNHGSGDASLRREKALKKRLEHFVDSFLVQNQDLDRSTSEPSSEDPWELGRFYRRTVIRSIMIVSLLDKARLSPGTSFSGCLFLPSSPYKSSVAVLKGLARVLLPSCGDVTKALFQLDCQLSYQQHPLEEYEYEISNLAVDLRDGVRLTRIVELLLYPSASCLGDTSDAILTETSLSDSRPEGYQWPLSKQLRFPCLGRAVKAFNVKTALDALASTKEGKLLIRNVSPDDIVDGHREKTIALLWGLVSKWGLSELVDLEDLRKEVGQLKQRAISQFGLESVDKFGNRGQLDENESDEAAVLLKQWAFLVAQLRGLHVESLTTSFGDGRVYECILNEYEGYILDQSQSCMSTDGKTSLGDRLRALGCSTQFVELVSPGIQNYILNSESTIGALAFFCSRLLPVTKRVRAVTVLQNAWRRVLSRRELQRRAVAREVARQCAAVVQTRDQILWAKEVIVHWWRKMRARRRRTTTTMRRERRSTRLPRRQWK